jgi:hypothetical protein
MTKYIFILGTLFLLSCNTPIETRKQLINSPDLKDTSITIVTNSQNLEIFFDSVGNLEIIKSKIGDSVQNIFCDKRGRLIQIQNLTGEKEEFTAYYFPNGQIKKIKRINNESKGQNDAFLWFAPSTTQKLLIDYDKSFVPAIKGLEDTFAVNKEYTLKIYDVFQLSKTNRV